jgi:hypothetical protein
MGKEKKTGEAWKRKKTENRKKRSQIFENVFLVFAYLSKY